MKTKLRPKVIAIVACVLISWFLVPSLQAQTGFTEKDRQTLTALQVRAEETAKALETLRHDTNKRFEELRQDTNKRFEELRQDMNARFQAVDKRFEAVDKRFEELREDMNKRFEMVDKRFEAVDKRFEQLLHFLYILAGIFTTLVVAVIAFAYWDRRTIIREARKQTLDQLERQGIVRRIILALQEYSQKDNDLRQILKSFDLL
ncbi:MAG: hypothetical protein ACUVWY_02060 [Desulfosoma sp.]|uniref:hypothetical protein n=1 Tax=Desulfosoma sp. TaxID=2603217 RepID=UPI00404A4B1F